MRPKIAVPLSMLLIAVAGPTLGAELPAELAVGVENSLTKVFCDEPLDCQSAILDHRGS